MKAVATFWDVEKIKQMEEWQAEYSSSLKPRCQGD